MDLRIGLLFALFVLSHSATALEKRVIEFDQNEHGFQQAIFETLAHFEPQSDRITVEIGREGARTYTLFAQFENPEENREGALLEERIQCRRFRNLENAFEYACRFEIYARERIKSAFYREGVSSTFSDALASFIESGESQYRGLGRTSGRDEAKVKLSGRKSNVECRRDFKFPQYSRCNFFLSQTLTVEAAEAVLEEIRSREPWFSGLEESFHLNQFDLRYLRLRIHFHGGFQLIANYYSTEQAGRQLVLNGRYRRGNGIEVSQFSGLAIQSFED